MTGVSPISREHRTTKTASLLSEAASSPEPQRQALLDEAVLLNRSLADSIASRYSGRGIALEDLRQVAYEGLVKAVQRFDPTPENNFVTFAVPTIRGEVQRHFRDLGWSVRPPRRIQELQQRISRVGEELHQQLGHEPDTAQMAAALDVTVEEYNEAREAYGSFSPTSLDQPRGDDDGQRVGDHIADDDADHRAAEARLMLAPVVRNLPSRDRRLLYLRFYEDRTQAEIGAELGVTQMQVSRLLSGVYATLRQAVGE